MSNNKKKVNKKQAKDLATALADNFQKLAELAEKETDDNTYPMQTWATVAALIDSQSRRTGANLFSYDYIQNTVKGMILHAEENLDFVAMLINILESDSRESELDLCVQLMSQSPAMSEEHLERMKSQRTFSGNFLAPTQEEVEVLVRVFDDDLNKVRGIAGYAPLASEDDSILDSSILYKSNEEGGAK